MSEVPRSAVAQARLDTRREDLVHAAAKLFVSKGYHNTSVAGIVAELGLSHGTFYNYFDSRRDILDAVVALGFEQISEHLFGDATDPARSLDAFIGQFVGINERLRSLVGTDSALFRFVVFEAAAIDEAVTLRLLEAFKRFGILFGEHVRAGVASGFLRADLDPEVGGDSVAALLLGSALGAMNQPGAQASDDFVDALGDFLRNGFGRPT